MVQKVKDPKVGISIATRLKRFGRTFLRGEPNVGPLRHGKIWVDAMAGMATGFLASLVVGSIIGLFGIYSPSNAFRDVSRIMSMVTPFAIGIGIGYRARLDALRTISLAIVVFIAARSDLIPHALNGTIDFTSGVARINTKVEYIGDVLSTIVNGAIMLYVFHFTRRFRTNLDFLLVPLVCMLFAIGLAFSVTYLVALVTVAIELIIYYTAQQSTALALVVAPIIGAIMGLAITLPISSAALALGLKLTGDAALAAIAGTAAQMMCWGVMTHWAGRKWTDSLVISFGSPMLHITNYSRRPQLLIIPTIVSAVTALISVAIFGGKLPFTLQTIEIDGVTEAVGAVTTGMGSVALYGQIFTILDNTSSVYSWTNVIFIQLIFPALFSMPLVYLTGRFLPKFLQKRWLTLWED